MGPSLSPGITCRQPETSLLTSHSSPPPLLSRLSSTTFLPVALFARDLSPISADEKQQYGNDRLARRHKVSFPFSTTSSPPPPRLGSPLSTTDDYFALRQRHIPLFVWPLATLPVVLPLYYRQKSKEGKVAPFWRSRVFLRSRPSRATVPWKQHILPRLQQQLQQQLQQKKQPHSSRILRHLSNYKASFLAGYHATRTPLNPSPNFRAYLRDKLLRFHLETFPRYRQRAHSRLYRFVVDRVTYRRQTRQRQLTLRLLPLGLKPPYLTGKTASEAANARVRELIAKLPKMSYDYQNQERGSRRRRFAAMANNVYRAGVAAASEIRDQYNTSRVRDSDGSGSEWEEDRPPNIPGAFPDVSFATGGNAQMVLFPMYAKRHVRKFKPSSGRQSADYSSDDSGMSGESPNWTQEFARLEDEKAVVDVNVHGWLYLVNQGPLTRKNRLLIGLARRLSGIPAPQQTLPVDISGMPVGADGSIKDAHEARKIQRAAEEIERRGQGEKDAAARGEYSETTDQAARYDDSSSEDGHGRHRRPPPPAPGPGKLTPKSSWAATSINSTATTPEMTETEMIAANTNLLSRLGPFLTTPVEQQPVTLFFYNEDRSQSRTVLTTESGHFVTCASLDFVPTHVRILVASGSGNGGQGAGVNDSVASETALVNSLTHPLSAVAPIQLVEDRGISLISDIDDTIKTSNIALGTREIFRNTFVRDLADMTVDGAREWYTALHDLGVQFHYCSNSPWQLFPVLTTFFKRAGLPKGPLHLKQYSGMLQGIFEPVAERKRGTLEKILRDFPNRRFLLVGDSGEADLEVYTELVLAHPGRVLAIFIRDVTTPQQQGYFDSLTSSRTLDPNYGPSSPGPERRPSLPARIATAPPQQQQQQQQQQRQTAPRQGPVMGTLIDLDDAPADTPPPVKTSTSADHVPTLPPRKPLPPPRPSKPLALRGSAAATASAAASSAATAATSVASTAATAASAVTAVAGTAAASAASAISSARSTPPPPPAPRRRAVGSTASTPTERSSPDLGGPPPPPPPPRRSQPSGFDGSSGGTDNARQRQQYPYQGPPVSPQPQQQQQLPPNKKVDLWHRRLAHAQDILAPHGVALYTWRRGQDVAVEAVGIVKRAMSRE